jgi:DNA-binding transcriptional MerR regulator
MQNKIPDKLYFKIGEVARMAEVPTHVIRYWESEFDGIRPKRANSKQRLFRRQDIELILKVKTLLHHQGYTIAGAKKFLAAGQEPEAPIQSDESDPADVLARLKDLKDKIKELQQLLITQKD